MILLVGGEKGGTGKTTIATNLAVRRLQASGDLLLVDTDKQGSASAWAAIRDGHEPSQRITSVQKFGNTIPKEVIELSKRFKDVVIDAGGRDSIELRAAMTVADLLVIPTQASQFDVWTLGTINDLVLQAQALNPKLKAFVAVNRASTNPSVTEADEIQELLEDFEQLSLCETIIRDRIAYRKAAKSGLSVVELQPADDKATNEINALYEEVFHG